MKLKRQEYLDTVRGFQLRQGIPNLNSNAYDWRVDPYEPNRVWFTIRTTGTHTGAFKFGRATYAATGSTITGPPECCSYTFDKVNLGGTGHAHRRESSRIVPIKCGDGPRLDHPSHTACLPRLFVQDGKVTSFTGGYVMDNRVGNTGASAGWRHASTCTFNHACVLV